MQHYIQLIVRAALVLVCGVAFGAVPIVGRWAFVDGPTWLAGSGDTIFVACAIAMVLMVSATAGAVLLLVQTIMEPR